MTAPEQPPAPVVLVDPGTLTHAQTGGWDCVHCGRRLGDTGKPLGTVTINHGTTRMTHEVWACDPACGVHPAHPEPTPWMLFLDHAMGCADCTDGERCGVGNELHDAVRAAPATEAP
ncbi:hypothetical protein [Streptomyces sp. RTd22]|uniref:hypothetical protein n=1 Tax=Streptomyces sp. RTd22 TaxID=1841249 RepID=UPI0007C4B66B|nr:hypothetical protein [Streptomyces sp. RTd22]